MMVMGKIDGGNLFPGNADLLKSSFPDLLIIFRINATVNDNPALSGIGDKSIARF